MLRSISTIFSSSISLSVISLTLLVSFGSLFYIDTKVKRNAQQLHILTINAERILNADHTSTTAVRLAASLKSDRYVLNYQDHQDTKYSLLSEISDFPKNVQVKDAFRKMEAVQGEIEELEADAIGFIDEEQWDKALQLVTEPAFRRLKGIYRANLSSALRAMILESESQDQRARDMAQLLKLAVLGVFLLLALIGFLYAREMRRSLRRQSELATGLENANKYLEERVVQRTAELRNVSDTASDAIITINPQSEILSWNAAATRIFGHSAADAIGQHVNLIVPEDLRDDIVAGLANIISSGGADLLGKTVELEGLRKNGEIFPIELSLASWVGEEARVFCGIMRDITERKEAEQQLTDEKEILDTTLEAMDQGITMVDEELKFRTFNRKVLKLLELPEAIVEVGSSMEIGFRYNAERGEYGEGDTEQQIQDRMALARKFEAHQFERTRPDGVVLEIRGKALPNRKGFVTTYTDITARKQAEAEVARQRAVLDTTIQSMPLGVIMVGADMRLSTFNEIIVQSFNSDPEFLAARPTVEELLRYWIDTSGQAGDRYEKALKTFYSKEAISTELDLPDGRYYEVRQSPLADGGFVRTYSNITERKQAEQQLAKEKAILDVTLEAMDQGIIMYDENLNVLIHNERARKLWGYSDQVLKLGATNSELIADLSRRGELDQNQGDTVEAAEQRLVSRKAHVIEREFNDGRVLEIRRRPTPAGGFVATQTDITDRKKAEIELQNAYSIIRESVEYASNIQRAALPFPELMHAMFEDNFVIWEPRDVVGGDLYWVLPAPRGCVVAVADCTGHGVPGAFVTLVASGALRFALSEFPEGDPAHLISRMNYFVKDVLSQYTDDALSDDGLEIGICRIDYDAKSLDYAGARFSLWQMNGDNAREIRGDKTGIGYKAVPINLDLNNHVIENIDGAAFYLFSDGFNDQIGGKRRLGLGKRRIVKQLIAGQNLSMTEQRTAMLTMFADFQGDEVRRDDLTMLGFRLSC